MLGTAIALITSILVGSLAVLYIGFSISYSYWKRRGLPHLKPSFPFGNFREALTFKKHAGEVYQEIYNKFKDKGVVGYYLVYRPGVMFTEPELLKHVLVKDFAYFQDHGVHFDEAHDPLSIHLFTLKGPRWRSLRSKMSPAFTSGKMKSFFPHIITCGRRLEDHLRGMAEKTQDVEMRDMIARYSTDIIALTAYGIEVNSIENPTNEFRTLGKKTFEITIRNSICQSSNMLFPPIAKAFKIPFFHKEVTKYFMDIAKEIMDTRESKKINRNDFMDLLIQLKKYGIIESAESDEKQTDKTPLTFVEVAANMYAFFLAGFETSSTATSFFLLEMALNPDVQMKVRNDINEAIAKHGELTYEAVGDMHYLEMALNETLRKYPPLVVLMREVTKNYVVPDRDIVLEKGTHVTIPVLAIHMDPEYYPDPQRFDPERFSEREKAKRPNYTFMPFGEGPRICIGKRMGLLQSKVALASVLSKYEVSVCDKTVREVKINPMSFLYAPLSGIWLKISLAK